MTISWLDKDKIKGIKQSASDGRKKFKKKNAKGMIIKSDGMVAFYDTVLYLCEMVEKLNKELERRST